MIRRTATTSSSGRSTSSMRLWSQRSRSTPMGIRYSSRRCRSWRTRRRNGAPFGRRRVRKRSEGPQIWLIRSSSVPLIDARGLMDRMSHLICTWNSNIIAAPRPKERTWRRRSAWPRKRAARSRLPWTFHLVTLKNSDRTSGKRIRCDALDMICLAL